jgi:exocyst complex component 2
MALDIVKLYISLLGQFFTLSDISIASARKPGQSASQSSNLGQTTGHADAAMPDFVPKNANSLVTCHYASKILAEILDSAGEIDALAGSNKGQNVTSPVTSTDLGQEAKKAMRDFVESCRWRLEEALCATWSRGE